MIDYKMLLGPEILSMASNYEERKVARDDINGFTIDTVLVTDRSWKYETAIEHDDFNDGHWIIVEGYDTKEDAVTGHEKWLEKCSKNDIVEFTDCYTKIEFVKEED